MSVKKAKRMNQTTKEVHEFASKSPAQKWDALRRPQRPCYNPALYIEAESLRANLSQWHYFVKTDGENSRATSNRVAYLAYVDQLLGRFHSANKSKDGTFFRALADALDRTENPAFNKLARFIIGACRWSEAVGESLPSASQLRNGWKINCGVLPDRPADLKYIWQEVLGNEPMPATIKKMKEILARDFPLTDQSAQHVEIIQIQREAKKLGYKLPRQKGQNAMPVGICPKEIREAAF